MALLAIPHDLSDLFCNSGTRDCWEATIKEQRQRILRVLRKNLSLKTGLDETRCDAYSDARLIARRETGLPEALFPQDSPCNWKQTPRKQQ